MSKYQNVLLRSLMLNTTPEGEARRRQELHDIAQPLKRMVGLALHEVTLQHPGYVAHKLGVDLAALRQVQFVGAGMDAVVFKSDDQEVRKLHHGTLGLSPAALEQAARERQASYELLAEHLGTFTLPQYSFVGAHPFIPGAQVVQTRQPYRVITDPQLFVRDSDRADPAAVTALITAHPDTVSQLNDFVTFSATLYDAHRIVPDTRGRGNLALEDSGTMLLIDAHPTLATDTIGQARTMNQLAHLASLLPSAA